jgi:hypothetical protein
MNRNLSKLLLLAVLTLPILISCSSGATGAAETLHPLDKAAKARKEKKEDSALK